MKFIHLSDLHFNTNSDGRTSRNLRDELLTYIYKQGLQADELFITGDFRDARVQHNEPEYINEVVNYIKQIAGAAKIQSNDHIHIVPGNHDRDRKPGDAGENKKIQDSYQVDKGVISAANMDFINTRFEYFYQICDALYGPDNYWTMKPLHTYRVSDKTVFLYLNTSITHCSNEDRGSLIIGNDCLDRLLSEINKQYPKYPIFVLAHHSPDFFEYQEKKAVEEIFEKYPKVEWYLCGDAHEQWMQRVNNHIEMTVGCIRHDSDVEATFFYGDTDASRFLVYHWAKGWQPYEYYNQKLKQLFYQKIRLSDDHINDEKNRLKNMTLLPWMRNNPSLGTVFPELFIEPTCFGEKTRRTYLYLDIIEELETNERKYLIFTGGAGTGKTTLLQNLFLFKNQDNRFLYLHAKDLQKPYEAQSPYQKYIRDLLLTGENDENNHYHIFLDGIDEAYAESSGELTHLMASISNLKKTTVWFGWRQDHLSYYETEAIQQLADDIIFILPWNSKMAHKYVMGYSEVVHKPDIISDYDSLVERNTTIKAFSSSPFQLTLLVYLLDNQQNDSAIKTFFEKKTQAISSLYAAFFQCWLKKEQNRGTSYLSSEDIRDALWLISRELYYKTTCRVDEGDSAVTGLLTFSYLGNEKIATGFFHHSFCAYFVADKIYTALKTGGTELIKALKMPLKNDVTDFVRSAVSCERKDEIIKIQKNLIDVYSRTRGFRNIILKSCDRRKAIVLSKKERTIIQNEIIYFVSRFPDYKNRVPKFLNSVYKKNKDPYILLDIAYAATLTGPHAIALEYAKTLVPGTENELINRSWTLAYFGDVQDSPYDYRDTENASWTKAREARLKRFQSSEMKAIRFRILDFPLMYCFYFGRNWEDVTDADYEIIKNTDIDNDHFSDDEKAFLRKQKEQLLQGFQVALSSLTL